MLVVAVAVIWSGAALRASGTGSETECHRGVCFVAEGYRPAEEAFDYLSALNLNWISQTPFGWQRNYDSPEVIMRTS